jgi:hypothetical protein
MDWTTMSGLYGDPEDYTAQLRKLESFCEANATDASAHFVLAYHYLVTGAKDEAVEALRIVVKSQPKDVTAKRMLDALAPAEEAIPTPAPAPAGSTKSDKPAGDLPTTDLVGSWVAQAGPTKIELSITEDSQFKWQATSADQKPIQLAGNLSFDAAYVALETKDQGSIGGNVESLGADKWKLMFAGAPANDPGLTFDRVK